MPLLCRNCCRRRVACSCSSMTLCGTSTGLGGASPLGKQHFLYFMPLPQKQGSLRPSLFGFRLLPDLGPLLMVRLIIPPATGILGCSKPKMTGAGRLYLCKIATPRSKYLISGSNFASVFLAKISSAEFLSLYSNDQIFCNK